MAAQMTQTHHYSRPDRKIPVAKKTTAPTPTNQTARVRVKGKNHNMEVHPVYFAPDTRPGDQKKLRRQIAVDGKG
jgi:hypothetical protein